MAPKLSIRVERVSKQRLREIFNECQYFSRTQAGEFREVVLYSSPAPITAGQRPGTKSEIIEYRDANDRVALVHQYTRPDGSIGASGLPDPKKVLKDNVLYILDFGE
jgi:hypothetical protein